MLEYKCPCGAKAAFPPDEQQRHEIACVVLGCRNCKNYNGTEFYQANPWKGIAMLAKRELSGDRI